MINNSIEQVKQDYNFALIHLLWCVNNGKRYLVFGMVELYPSEINDLCELPEQAGKFKHGYRLYYIRHKTTVNEALEWYRAIKENKRIGMDWNEGAKFFECGEMLDVRTWPNFELNNRLSQKDNNAPFIPDLWGTVRTHHIYPAAYNEKLENFLMYSEPAKWIKKYLLWDICLYRELIGSVHLVLPNPFYSKRRISLVPGENGEPDQVRIIFQPRKNKNLDELRVGYFETSSAGITGKSNLTIKNNTCYIKLMGEAGKFRLFVEGGDSYGLLDYSDEAPFIREIKCDLYYASREKVIHVPDKNGNELCVNRTISYEKADSFTTKGKNDSTQESEWGTKFTDENLRRRRISEAEKYGQKIFDCNDDAKKHIKNLIHSANEKIMIVDPYVSVTEIFRYAFDTKKDDLEITIITGKDEFVKSKIWKQTAEFAETHNVKIFGMTGERPVIHDRFLMIDNDIWLIGGSLNELGNRLSMIIRLPDPASLEEHLNKIMNSERVKIFKNGDWHDR